jgi:very-short-patch-repair endonuclease
MEKDYFDAVRRAQLLQKSTIYESRMCKILNSMGIDHIRQYPIRTGRNVYFADIYIPEKRLIIEMDGAYHFTKEQHRLDNNRSSNMRRKGYHIIRFANGDLRDIKKIISKLSRYV